MNDFPLADFLLLRRPAAPVTQHTLNIAVILADEAFLTALALAAPQFHTALLRKEAIDKKKRLTLLKYYNRYCFRPTPFGLFSGVTPASWHKKTVDSKSGSFFFAQADNHFAYQLGQMLVDGLKQRLAPNPTLYKLQREFRFIYTDTDAVTGDRQYLLQSTDYTTILKRLLQFCERGCEEESLVHFIQSESHCEVSEAEEYFEFLKDAQVVLPVTRPGITGRDHLLNLAGSIPAVRKRTAQLNGLEDFLGRCNQRYPITREEIAQLQTAASVLKPAQPFTGQSALNIIRLHQSEKATLSAYHKSILQDGLFALKRLLLQPGQTAIQQFIQQFNRYFEGQTVPLMTAMDPEVGIGYQEAESEDGNSLLETLHFSQLKEKPGQLPWTEVHKLLLNAWHQSPLGEELTIHLTIDVLAPITTEDQYADASGFSVLFRTNREQVWIESAGGYHTNSLIGRFTVASQQIADAAREMASCEQKLNPDIIFAELLHLSDLHTDNVNRRAAILDWEIPLTAASTLSISNQLSLSDLMVSIHDGKVLLTSRKHGKIVLPRLSSAYNHQLNKLPLFRFLADIPYQYSSNVQSLDLSQFFPGLRFYPRVVYKEAILALARWVLTKEDILLFAQGDEKAIVANFKALKNTIRLPDTFAMVQGDQQLVFRTHFEEEILFFSDCIVRSDEVILQEVMFSSASPAGKHSVVTRQYNAFILPSRPLPLSHPAATSNRSVRAKRKFMPGSEWLYLKIYISKTGTNTLLRQLSPFLKKRLQNGMIRKWFFIRYEDHAPHIRIRLLVLPANLGQVLMDMRSLFESKVASHVIREYMVDTYSRELERYGIAAFEEVENFFCTSSELILKYLIRRNRESLSEPYLFALAITQALVAAAIENKEEAIAYCYHRYSDFSAEFSGDKVHVELDKKFRSLKSQITDALSDEHYFKRLRLAQLNERTVRQFLSLVRKVKPSNNRSQLISSLIHMHLNRLFTSHSRKQEMIVFYLLYKWAKTNSVYAFNRKGG